MAAIKMAPAEMTAKGDEFDTVVAQMETLVKQLCGA